MLRAAHVAGKAINITQTTAGHAMCYKITSLFECAHGHAAILCDRVLYRWMIDHMDLCIDSRGEGFLKEILQNIAETMDCRTPAAAADRIDQIFRKLELYVPHPSEEEMEVLVKSVNPDRLKNHPLRLEENSIRELYQLIMKG